VTLLVLDASAVVDLLLRNPNGEAVRAHLEGGELHTVAHLDAEVFSALARLHREGTLSADAVDARLGMSSKGSPELRARWVWSSQGPAQLRGP
jgi:predicted nucleic acid-binding protein